MVYGANIPFIKTNNGSWVRGPTSPLRDLEAHRKTWIIQIAYRFLILIHSSHNIQHYNVIPILNMKCGSEVQMEYLHHTGPG